VFNSLSPNLDSTIVKQPHNSLTVNCSDGVPNELVWNLTHDGLSQPVILRTFAEEGIEGDLWYVFGRRGEEGEGKREEEMNEGTKEEG
jgi:hypothetical protein